MHLNRDGILLALLVLPACAGGHEGLAVTDPVVEVGGASVEPVCEDYTVLDEGQYPYSYKDFLVCLHGEVPADGCPARSDVDPIEALQAEFGDPPEGYYWDYANVLCGPEAGYPGCCYIIFVVMDNGRMST